MNNRWIRHAVVITFLVMQSMPTLSKTLSEGIALYEAGNVAAAQSVFAVLVADDPDNAEARYNLGLTQLAQDQLDAAVESFDRAIELNDEKSRYHQRLGEALGTQAGNAGPLKQMRMAGRIRDAFERAVELDGSNIDARFGLITFYLQAPAIAGGSTKKAAIQAEAIQKLDALRGQMAFATIYRNQGEHDKAEAIYRTAIQLHPDEADLYLALGIQLTALERYADAIAVYEAGLKSIPNDMSINYQIGRTASITGQYLERGRNGLEAYISGYTPTVDEPSLAWANYRLGLILQHMALGDQARKAFETALVYDPKHKEAKKALNRLR